MKTLGFALGLIGCVLAVCASASDDNTPPSISYGGQRQSKTWVETPKGQVAVDDGIEWEGVRVYLSLTWDLVVVDAKNGKTLWNRSVSAFWNGLAIKEVTAEKDKKTWAVELRTTSRDPKEKDLTQLYELKSGKELPVPGAPGKPAGTALKPKVFSGDASNLDKGFTVTVSTSENWDTVRDKMFKGLDKVSAPLAKDVDFEKDIVLVVSEGDTFNCRGIECAEAFEDDKRILVRLQRQTFQTLGGASQLRPYGIFVLPRAEKKAYIIEHNRQRYIGGPPLWAETKRFDRLKDPKQELDDAPWAGR